MDIETKTHYFRLGTIEDVERVQEFIKKEWNPEHILVKSRKLFNYEYAVGNRINVALAINKETKKIDCIFAFYQSSKNLANCDLWGSLWKVSSECKVPFLGQLLMKNICKITGAKSHSGVGLNPKTTVRIMKTMKDQTIGHLRHYYRLANIEEYRIAVIKDKRILDEVDGENNLIELATMEELRSKFDLGYSQRKPYKDEWYFEKRYFKHPIYNYNIWGIESESKVKAVLVGREIERNGSKILRIVDFIGEDNALGEAGRSINNIMINNKYEYIDFYQQGIDHVIMAKAGFVLKTEDDLNIIPNYFEPFVQENIDMWYHTSFEEPYYVFKADADQDRPNWLRSDCNEQ